MLKKSMLCLALMMGIVTIGLAQVSTNNKILEQAARGYRILEDDGYTRALSMAKQKGWPLVITGKNGAKAVLVGVDAFNYPKYYITNNNTIAAATTRANQLWPGGASGLNLSGSSDYLANKMGIWDGGRPLDAHVELTGRIVQKEAATVAYDDHATHTTGTLMASGVNPYAKGMSFGLKSIIAYDFKNDISEMALEAPGLLISNHSYSIIAGWNYNDTKSRWEFYGRPNENRDYKFGYYSIDAQALDSITYYAPNYLIVKSAGNNRTSNGPPVDSPYYRYDASNQMVLAGKRPAGISNNDSYGSIPWDCNAKNILTIGAVQGLPNGYSRPSDVVMANFSSWGPTDDGRIKPDLVADGVNVLSSIATSNKSYASYSGTSMASPNAAGSLFLLQEYYSKLKSSSSAFMRSATLKGLAIHTTEAAGTNPGPNYMFGWGLLNVEKAAAVMTAAIGSNNAATSTHLLYEKSLDNNSSSSFTIPVVSSGNGPLKATISWTDVAGPVETVMSDTTKRLVNDLDLRITQGSRTYMPWTLNPTNPGAAAVPGDNRTDNIERIDIDSTVPGRTYTITVTHKGSLVNGGQAYTLLVSGAGGTAYCASTPTSNAGSRIDSVSFSSIHYANPGTATTYTDNTKLTANIEPLQNIPIYVKVGSADASAASKIVKVFIDYNNNGSFADSGELVAVSSVLSNGSVFQATVSTPNTLVVGNFYMMRIVEEETTDTSVVTPCSNPGYVRGETQDYRLRAVPPSIDIAAAGIATPAALECPDNPKYFTVTLKNNGTAAQTNIPVQVVVKNSGGTTVATLTDTLKRNLASLSSDNFTLQTPVSSMAPGTYSITATASLPGDQLPANNTITTSITISSSPAGPAATAELCSSTVFLKATNPQQGANYLWYTSATTASPFATGASTNTATITSDKTYYAGTDADVFIGPTTKMAYDSGGYNNFSGNLIKFNNSVPVILKSVRLYTSNPGTIKFTVANLGSADLTNRTYTYTILATTTLNVSSSNPVIQPATSGEVKGNDPKDTGAVYFLNLPVTQTGDHILITECDAGGATIFRNNNIAGSNTYPKGIPGIMTITGNTLDVFPQSGQPSSAYYYFLYNLNVTTGACMSARTAVVATSPIAPVITQVGDSLVSSVGGNLQWYVDGQAISGANGQKYKPVNSGAYTVSITDGIGCMKTSNPFQVAVTAIPPEVLAREIKLSVSPNPNDGRFNLSFEVNTKADLGIAVFNAAGQQVYLRSYPGFSGKFSSQIDLGQLSAEFYILKIQHDKKTYSQKILIER
ncbi:Por secretion system C-terminal sorting domain-containing protein [Hydrobacter penzbergensis]|uniref:Por secretion system C-terminal sorting domain-containing protein n=1 Tax=Hydrobacter penzbergensis TaxID=1235997 RepID=A0A8X8IGD2_9BACT|nr:S8 family serine peptidase [Hydrobacter penzbergensis]SDX13643.1 Por secretion system C-terminal sorting domain-containing protein [Hydrobacter penzbergensis]